jgi:hypothetical protein
MRLFALVLSDDPLALDLIDYQGTSGGDRLNSSNDSSTASATPVGFVNSVGRICACGREADAFTHLGARAFVGAGAPSSSN